MNRWIPVALLLAVPFTSGCFRGAAALGAGMLVGAAIVAESDRERPREEVVVYENAPPVYVVTQPARVAPPPPPPAPPVPFDPAAAKESLEGVDLGACRASGAPLGYGHARVTFQPDGTVTHVAIDSPSGLSDSAVRCLGAALGTATAPPFEGAPAAVPAPFYVK
jgi:hypothetical protein